MRGLARAAGLEPRVAGALSEERAERRLLVPQRLLEGDRGYLGQEREVRVFFIAVSARSVSAYEVPFRSAAYRACRAARVRFQTTRTQPNVRASTCCCASSGYARHRYAILTITG